MKEFYVYVYLDTRKQGLYKFGDFQFDYEPFYIGKGKNNRCLYHLNEKKVTNVLKTRIIEKIRLETKNEPIVLIIKDNLSSNDAFALEKRIIKLIGRRDIKTGPLSNLTDGGDGGPNWTLGKKLSEKHKNKISSTLIEYYKSHDNSRRGIIMSDDEREWRSNHQKNIWNHLSSEEYIKRVQNISFNDKEVQAKINILRKQCKVGNFKFKYTLQFKNQIYEDIKDLTLFCKEHQLNSKAIRTIFSIKQQDKIVYKQWIIDRTKCN